MVNARKADTSAAKIFKQLARRGLSPGDREKAKESRIKLAGEIANPSVREAFQNICEYLSIRERLKELGQTSPPPTSDVLTIGRFGMVKASEFAWTEAECESSLGDAATELMTSAPSLKFL